MRGNRTEGDDRQRVIMVLPSSHRPSVEALAREEQQAALELGL